jgi:hypothetical protein
MDMITEPHTYNTDEGKHTSEDIRSSHEEWWRYVDNGGSERVSRRSRSFLNSTIRALDSDYDRPKMIFLEDLRGHPGPSWEGYVRIRRLDMEDVGCGGCLGDGCLGIGGYWGRGESSKSAKTRFLLIKGHFGWVFEDDRGDPTGDIFDLHVAAIEEGKNYGKKIVLDIQAPSHTRYFLSFPSLEEAKSCRAFIENTIARLKDGHRRSLPSI